MKKRILSIVLCLCMLLALAPAASADGGNYLALGDSISTGYGLADASTEGFAQIVAAEAGYALENFAVNGNTADGILAQLASGELDEAVAVADVITITCGGNDLMAALYTAVVDTYNASAAEEDKLAPDEVTTVMTDSTDPRYFDLLITAQGVLAGSETKGIPPFAESDAFVTALEAYVTNLHNAIGEIRSRNADARILVATQYHPYATFSGMYAILNDGIAPGVAALNEAIVSTADAIGYEVADVYSAFEAAVAEGVNPCNATTTPLELDFHPNAAGHEVIAEVMLATLAGETVTEPTTEPTVEPTEPLPETVDALYADMNFVVNGETVSLEVYEINGNNYFKLRDLAQLVSGTEKQFNVVWDDAIRNIDLVSNAPYAPVGGELAEGDGTNKTGKLNASPIFKDGESVTLAAYTINGNNYFKLRDLCRAFDIGVTWNEATWTVGIDTSVGYTD